MKYILLFVCLYSITAHAQFSSSILDYNNVSARVTDGGLLFNNAIASAPGYEIPKGSGLHAIYTSAFWFGGTDANGQLYLSGTRYSGGSDIFPGPIADPGMYTSAGYTSQYLNSIWTVVQDDIDDHILNWNQPGYTVPTSIANWPGNGDTSLGVADQLAPYVDVNNNAIYEPELGDYPNIRGDQATYIIMNDAANVHTSSGGNALGIEVHLMVYQYATSDYLNDITFINAHVFNRGNVSYSDFRTSYFVDGDLGNPNDDYMGSDPSRNMIFTFNGDLIDEGYYETNPPAIGVVSLSQTMSGAGYFTTGGVASQSDPNTASEYWNYMNNKWRFGESWVYGGTGFPSSIGSTSLQTNYMFPTVTPIGASFTWDESSSNNPPGDRRMFMNIETVNLQAGEDVCYDFAAVFANGGPNLFSSLSNLENNVDQLQLFFDAQDFSCETVTTVGNDELSLLETSIYPNPSSGIFHISIGQAIDQFTVNVFDLTGRVIFSEDFDNRQEIDLNLNGHKGAYIIQVESSVGNAVERVLVE